MADSVLDFKDILGPYTGYVVGGAGLAAVLLLNQLIYRYRWKSYPTEIQYLAAHPECKKADGAVCNRCGRKPARLGVSGRGHIYRCTWCEDELYRIDRNGGS